MSLNSVRAPHDSSHEPSAQSPTRPIYKSPSSIHIRVVFDRGDKDYRYESIPVDIENQGESLMLQLQRLRIMRTRGLQYVFKTLWDAFNMRQDAIWLVSASLVSLLLAHQHLVLIILTIKLVLHKYKH